MWIENPSPKPCSPDSSPQTEFQSSSSSSSNSSSQSSLGLSGCSGYYECSDVSAENSNTSTSSSSASISTLPNNKQHRNKVKLSKSLSDLIAFSPATTTTTTCSSSSVSGSSRSICSGLSSELSSTINNTVGDSVSAAVTVISICPSGDDDSNHLMLQNEQSTNQQNLHGTSTFIQNLTKKILIGNQQRGNSLPMSNETDQSKKHHLKLPQPKNGQMKATHSMSMSSLTSVGLLTSCLPTRATSPGQQSDLDSMDSDDVDGKPNESSTTTEKDLIQPINNRIFAPIQRFGRYFHTKRSTSELNLNHKNPEKLIPKLPNKLQSNTKPSGPAISIPDLSILLDDHPNSINSVQEKNIDNKINVEINQTRHYKKKQDNNWPNSVVNQKRSMNPYSKMSPLKTMSKPLPVVPFESNALQVPLSSINATKTLPKMNLMSTMVQIPTADSNLSLGCSLQCISMNDGQISSGPVRPSPPPIPPKPTNLFKSRPTTSASTTVTLNSVGQKVHNHMDDHRYLTYGTSAQLQQEYGKFLPWPTLTEFRLRRKLRRFKRRARKIFSNSNNILGRSSSSLIDRIQNMRRLMRMAKLAKQDPQQMLNEMLSQYGGQYYYGTADGDPKHQQQNMSRSSSLTSLLNLIEEANKNLLNSFQEEDLDDPLMKTLSSFKNNTVDDNGQKSTERTLPPKCPPRLNRTMSSINFGDNSTLSYGQENQQKIHAKSQLQLSMQQDNNNNDIPCPFDRKIQHFQTFTTGNRTCNENNPISKDKNDSVDDNNNLTGDGQKSHYPVDNYRIAFVDQSAQAQVLKHGQSSMKNFQDFDTISVKSLDSYFGQPLSLSNLTANVPQEDSIGASKMANQQEQKNSKILCVRSHFQINNGTIYLEDSDWEMCSEISEPLSLTIVEPTLPSMPEDQKQQQQSEPKDQSTNIESTTTAIDNNDLNINSNINQLITNVNDPKSQTKEEKQTNSNVSEIKKIFETTHQMQQQNIQQEEDEEIICQEHKPATPTPTLISSNGRRPGQKSHPPPPPPPSPPTQKQQQQQKRMKKSRAPLPPTATTPTSTMARNATTPTPCSTSTNSMPSTSSINECETLERMKRKQELNVVIKRQMEAASAAAASCKKVNTLPSGTSSNGTLKSMMANRRGSMLSNSSTASNLKRFKFLKKKSKPLMKKNKKDLDDPDKLLTTRINPENYPESNNSVKFLIEQFNQNETIQRLLNKQLDNSEQQNLNNGHKNWLQNQLEKYRRKNNQQVTDLNSEIQNQTPSSSGIGFCLMDIENLVRKIIVEQQQVKVNQHEDNSSQNLLLMLMLQYQQYQQTQTQQQLQELKMMQQQQTKAQILVPNEIDNQQSTNEPVQKNNVQLKSSEPEESEKYELQKILLQIQKLLEQQQQKELQSNIEMDEPKTNDQTQINNDGSQNEGLEQNTDDQIEKEKEKLIPRPELPELESEKVEIKSQSQVNRFVNKILLNNKQQINEKEEIANKSIPLTKMINKVHVMGPSKYNDSKSNEPEQANNPSIEAVVNCEGKLAEPLHRTVLELKPNGNQGTNGQNHSKFNLINTLRYRLEKKKMKQKQLKAMANVNDSCLSLTTVLEDEELSTPMVTLANTSTIEIKLQQNQLQELPVNQTITVNKTNKPSTFKRLMLFASSSKVGTDKKKNNKQQMNISEPYPLGIESLLSGSCDGATPVENRRLINGRFFNDHNSTRIVRCQSEKNFRSIIMLNESTKMDDQFNNDEDDDDHFDDHDEDEVDEDFIDEETELPEDDQEYLDDDDDDDDSYYFNYNNNRFNRYINYSAYNGRPIQMFGGSQLNLSTTNSSTTSMSTNGSNVHFQPQRFVSRTKLLNNSRLNHSIQKTPIRSTQETKQQNNRKTCQSMISLRSQKPAVTFTLPRSFRSDQQKLLTSDRQNSQDFYQNDLSNQGRLKQNYLEEDEETDLEDEDDYAYLTEDGSTSQQLYGWNHLSAKSKLNERYFRRRANNNKIETIRS